VTFCTNVARSLLPQRQSCELLFSAVTMRTNRRAIIPIQHSTVDYLESNLPRNDCARSAIRVAFAQHRALSIGYSKRPRTGIFFERSDVWTFYQASIRRR
jgi:hypothetical protein